MEPKYICRGDGGGGGDGTRRPILDLETIDAAVLRHDLHLPSTRQIWWIIL